MVLAGAVVQPDVRIGSHAVINTAASVDHDSILDDYTHVAPGVRLAGQVRVRAQSLIGIGACVTPGVCIGEGSVVGAGSVVIRNIPDKVIALGAPARITSESRPRRRAA